MSNVKDRIRLFENKKNDARAKLKPARLKLPLNKTAWDASSKDGDTSGNINNGLASPPISKSPKRQYEGKFSSLSSKNMALVTDEIDFPHKVQDRKKILLEKNIVVEQGNNKNEKIKNNNNSLNHQQNEK